MMNDDHDNAQTDREMLERFAQAGVIPARQPERAMTTNAERARALLLGVTSDAHESDVERIEEALDAAEARGKEWRVRYEDGEYVRGHTDGWNGGFDAATVAVRNTIAPGVGLNQTEYVILNALRAARDGKTSQARPAEVLEGAPMVEGNLGGSNASIQSEYERGVRDAIAIVERGLGVDSVTLEVRALLDAHKGGG